MSADRFAIVELLGHRRFGARVSEVEVFGAKMMRAEVLGPRASETVAEQFIGAAAIYALTIVTEERARAINTPYQLRQALPALLDVADFVETLGEHHGQSSEPSPVRTIKDSDVCDCEHTRGSHFDAASMPCSMAGCACPSFRFDHAEGDAPTVALDIPF